MSAYHFLVYQDSAGEWRWQLWAPNGNIVADSGEGYTRARDARRAIRSMKVAVYRAEVR